MTTREQQILVVEDDPAIAGHLVRGLKQHGYGVELLTRGDQVASSLRRNSFACVILDLMLPGEHGFDVLQSVRAFSDIPVIVLTARTTLNDRLKSFELGATDFLPKPYFLEELIARLRIRVGRAPDAQRTFAGASVDGSARTVTVAGARVGLTRGELDILLYLMDRPDRAVPRDTLVEQALGGEESTGRAVDIHVSRLRKKLGPEAAAYIVTVRGIGYRFASEVA